MGSYKNPNICDYSVILSASQALQSVNILNVSYKEVLKYASKDDLVYFDPPYFPLTQTASFTSYSEFEFLEKEQIELFEIFKNLSKIGCNVIQSNSDTEFIKNLYKDFEIKEIFANRFINSKGSDRGKISEVIIKNLDFQLKIKLEKDQIKIVKIRGKQGMKTYLVTGGAGNVGGALVEKLVQDKTNFVVVVDDLSTGFLSKLPSSEHENWKFIKADVNDYREISAIMLAYNFHYVYHFAAVVGVLRTQENPVRVLNDISGIKHILNLAKNSSVKHVFFSSSSEVYGEPVELPQHEHRTPLNSRVPYAVVKNVGESFLKSYNQEYGLTFTIFRFFNTYGPNQSTDFVVSRFLSLALKGEDITIYGDGSQTRTFTYIDDNVDTIVTIMNNKLLENDVINIGSDKLSLKFPDVRVLINRNLSQKCRVTLV